MRASLVLAALSAAALTTACDDTASSGAGGNVATTGASMTNGSTGANATTSSGSMATTGASMTTGSGMGGSGAGTTRVDAAMGNAVPGSAEPAVADDGSVFVVWVTETGGKRDVMISRSTNGGTSFEPAIQLDDASIEPLVSMARHPYAFANGARVGVTFNDQQGNIYLYTSPLGGPLAFGQPVLVGKDVVTTFRDFPKGFFTPNGEIAVAYQGYPNSGARIFVAREGSGFTSEAASSGVPGVPCECCPLDAFTTGTDDLMVAFRNNLSDVREMWMAKALAASPGSFTKFAQVSTKEGNLATCPMQGPRIGDIGGGAFLAVWSARGAGNSDNGTVYAATSSNGGDSWSGGAPLPFVADEPTIAVGANGHLYVTGVTGNQKSAMIESTDGTSWTDPAPITTPDGAMAVPQSDANAGVVVIAGVSAAKSVWLQRLE